ncbi:related to ammonia permease [Rhynchosporium secalis]|uniref:Related to ammonia permease n=1 Tax=Rhynchosporium secalis TaxID=38038 RepID=A0A1E1MNX4_RHYSE|nr:related to ammonia permease [Rhynchosporium secalis]
MEGSGVIGDFKYAFHRGVLAEPVSTIPAFLFSEFQLIIKATVCAISVGGAMEKGRTLPITPFNFLWSTFIYCPLAHMVWSETGFLSNLGVLDFPGGTPLHIFSGTTATALSIYPSYPLFRSKRSFARTPSHLALHRPGNSLFQLLSLVTIRNSWLAFDAGTTLSFDFKSIMALCVTNLCASGGAFTWICMTYYETGKWSLDSTFMGAISGLVLITPSAGFIDMPTASCFGIGGAVICRQALRIKSTNLAQRLRWVDNGDTFATHTKAIATYDGVTIIDGGVFFDDDTRQLGVQLLEALIGFTWRFVGNYVLFALIDCVPGLEALAKDRMDTTGTVHAECEEEYHPFKNSSIELD